MVWFKFIKTYFKLKKYRSMETFYACVDARRPDAKIALREQLLELAGHHIKYIEFKNDVGQKNIGGTLTVMKEN